MKNLSFPKSNIWFMMALLAVTFMTTSCSDAAAVDPIVITVDDAAELVAFSIANQTYGAVNNLNYVAEEVLELVDCNETQTNDRTVSDTSSDGERAISYEISEEYSKTCDGGETVNYSFEADQSFTSIRYNHEQSVSGAWSIEGVQDGATEVIYNGPYNRTGQWTYNLREHHTDHVSYTSALVNLAYEVASERIIGGTSTFTLDGTSTVYESYSYAGDIEFLGSDQSIITFQTGEQYELDLETGEINPINP